MSKYPNQQPANTNSPSYHSWIKKSQKTGILRPGKTKKERNKS